MPRASGRETRARIIDTAIRLFADAGTIGTGMRELAAASDLTLPGLYYHFKSKQELIQAIFDERGARLRNNPELKRASTVEERVRRVASADFNEMQDDFMRLVVASAFSRDDDAAVTFARIRDGWEARWAKTLADASDLADGADVAAAARSVITSLLGIYLLDVCGIDMSAKAQIKEMARVIGTALTTRRS